MLDLCFVAFPGSSHRPLRAPAQADQKLPDVALVMAHVELLLDQVGHPRAGPQRGFIAQPLGTREQKFGGMFLIIESAQSAPGLGRNRYVFQRQYSEVKNHSLRWPLALFKTLQRLFDTPAQWDRLRIGKGHV